MCFGLAYGVMESMLVVTLVVLGVSKTSNNHTQKVKSPIRANKRAVLLLVPMLFGTTLASAQPDSSLEDMEGPGKFNGGMQKVSWKFSLHKYCRNFIYLLILFSNLFVIVLRHHQLKKSQPRNHQSFSRAILE